MNNDLSDKELLQAKHRLEEAQARNRQKERKARTRRLIQEGAILEKCIARNQAHESGRNQGFSVAAFVFW